MQTRRSAGTEVSVFWKVAFHFPAQLLHAVTAAVLPLRCVACDAVLEWKEGELCGPCSFSLQRQCGVQPDRFDGRLDPTRSWSWLSPRSEGRERQVVHRLKYGGRSRLGPALGAAMAREAPPEMWPNPERWGVVPIPLHRRKHRQRGYNQSEGLAAGWCGILGMTQHPLLTRTQHRRSLTRMGRRERLDLMQDSYLPVSGAAEVADHFEGWILLDDVVTTGATMEAAWSALRTVWSGPIDLVTLLDAA